MSNVRRNHVVAETLEGRQMMSAAPAVAAAAAHRAAAAAGTYAPLALGGLLQTPGVLSLASPALSANNADGTAQVLVTRLLGSDGPASVAYSTVPGTAVPGVDFTPVSGVLNFADGETSKMIVVPVLGNAAADPTRSLSMVLSDPTGAAMGLVSSSTLNLQNLKSIVNVANVGDPVSNLLPFAPVTLTRTGNTLLPAVVNYATTGGGSALPGLDYTPVSGIATFLPGQDTATVLVPLLQNAAGAAQSALTFSLTAAGDATVLGQTATRTINLANPQSAVSLVNPAATVVADAGQALVTVVRSGNTGLPAGVQYAVQPVLDAVGNAVQAVTGTLNFLAGETTKVIQIPVVQSALSEAGDAVNVVLSNPAVDTVLGPLKSQVVTVVNTPSTIQTADAVVVTDFAATVANVAITRTGNIATAATVGYTTTDDTARAGVEYTAKTGTVTFAPGQTVATISIPLAANPSSAPVTDFKLTLSDPANGGTLGSQAESVVVVRNNRSTLQLVAGAMDVSNQNGTVTLTVTRLGDTATSAATVNFATVDGTAKAGTDYTATAGTLAFAVGETVKTIAVPVAPNAVADAAEAFNVVLSSPAGNGVIGAVGQTAVTLRNVRSAAGFAVTQIKASEKVGMATVIVKRLGNTLLPGTVDFRTGDGTAVAGIDYSAVAGTLSFLANQLTASFDVPILKDALTEAPETVKLFLGNATGNVTLGTADAEITVTDKGSKLRVKGYDMLPTAASANGLVVWFDSALGKAPTADDLTLFARSKDKANGGGTAKAVAIRSVAYDAATGALSVSPVKPLKSNAFYQLVGKSAKITDLDGEALDGANTGAAGSPMNLILATGRKLKYVDKDGDVVSMVLKGPGAMELTRGTNGEGEVLTLLGTGPGSILTGKVKAVAGGTGKTTLTAIDGLAAGAVNSLPMSVFSLVQSDN